jgi:hypothetical protein
MSVATLANEAADATSECVIGNHPDFQTEQ